MKRIVVGLLVAALLSFGFVGQSVQQVDGDSLGVNWNSCHCG